MSAASGRTVFPLVAWGFLFPAALFWAGCAPAAPARTVTVEESARTITVVGRGEVTAKPDIVRTTAGVEASAPTVGEAMKRATAQMTAVLDALKKLGIADKDLRTQNFSIHYEPPQPFQPEPRPMLAPVPPPGRGPAPPAPPAPPPEPARGSYRVSNMVEIVIRDPSKAGSVLETAVNAGANSVWNLSFALDDTAALEAEARKKAVADARARAEVLAKLHGMPLGPVVSVSELVGRSPVPPVPMMMEMASRAGGPPLEGGELTFSTTLEIVYTLGPSPAGD